MPRCALKHAEIIEGLTPHYSTNKPLPSSHLTAAFAVGALTNIPALQQFCLVAALAVLADFVLQVN